MGNEKRDCLGVFATKAEVNECGIAADACFVNKIGVIQFYLKKISTMPDDMETGKEKFVVCYDNSLTDVIDDNHAFSDQFRAEYYATQLEKHLFRFSYDKNYTNYDVVTDVKAIAKPESYYDGKKFISIPLVRSNSVAEGKLTCDSLCDSIRENRFLSSLKKIDLRGCAEIPYLIYYDADMFEYRIVGNFTGFEFNNANGVRFDCENLQTFPFEEDWYDDVIAFPDDHCMIYVGNYAHLKIMKRLSGEEACTTSIGEMIGETIEIGEEDMARRQTKTVPKADAAENQKKKDIAVAEKFVKEEKNTEMDFIRHFAAVARKKGLYYDEKDLINFHTSVKSSPFVILSGLSGTGKSRLVQCYAEALSLDSTEFCMAPVRPSWTDDSDLFGFVNIAQNIFSPSDSNILNVLLEAEKKENENKLYLICLDEMNLARIEHYFSQLLSILEMPVENRFLRIYSPELEARLYNGSKYKSTIRIGDNVRFVGTVNFDESTQIFSDKVLDRANLLELEVMPYTMWKKAENEAKNTSETSWSGDYASLVKKPEGNVLTDKETEFFWNVHTLFHSSSKTLGVGPRVLKQIGRYLENLPEVKDGSGISRSEGLDRQFVQRILTKVRGQNAQLKQIFADENGLESLFDKYADLSDFAKSREVLTQKKKESEAYGYTI